MTRDESGVESAEDALRAAAVRIGDAGEVVLRERPTMEHVLLLLFLVVGTYMYLGVDEFASAAQTFPRLMAGATVLLSVLILCRNYLTIVGPVVVAIIGAYYTYQGALAFTQDGGGLLTLVGGVLFLVAGTVFRERVGSTVESFVAEPMQALGGDGMGSAPETDATDGEEAETQAVESDEDPSDNSGAMYVYEIDDWRGPVVTGLLCIGYMLLTFAIGMLYATPVFVAAWALWAKMDRVRGAALTVLSFITAYLFYAAITDDIAEGWLTGWEFPAPDELLGLSTQAMTALEYGVVLL